MALEITDAYSHCGLRKYRPVEDVKRVAAAYGVARTVLVQHMGEYDNSYIAGIVASDPGRFAGVFLVDLASPGAMNEVTRCAESGRFRGIRMTAASLQTHRALWQWAAQLKLHILVSSSPDAPEAAAQFARERPGATIGLTHFGYLNPKEAPAFPSFRKVLALAEHKNVFVQVSGMHQFGTPPYKELVPAIARLYEAFGATRLLYGSNFPVMKEDPVYGLEIDLLRSGKLGIPVSAIPQVMNANALRIWFRK